MVHATLDLSLNVYYCTIGKNAYPMQFHPYIFEVPKGKNMLAAAKADPVFKNFRRSTNFDLFSLSMMCYA